MAGYIDTLTGLVSGFSIGGSIGIAINIILVIGAIALGFLLYWKMLRFRIPVEIWQFEPFQIKTDMGRYDKKDGIRKLVLMKNRNKQIDNFIKYPIKKGFKTRDKIYLTEENGALRGLAIDKYQYFFNKAGAFLRPEEVYFDDGRELTPLIEASLYTQDGEDVFAKTLPVLAPTNNDSQNAFALETLDKIGKYHIPSLFEKLQHMFIIITAIIAGVVIYIINKID